VFVTKDLPIHQENTLPQMDDIDESETLKRANAATDVLAKCNIPDIIVIDKGTPQSFKLQYLFTRDQIDKKYRSQLMSLLETNMKGYYDQTWGWDLAEKTNEIFSADSKFLILRSSTTESSQQSIAAWIMFKFDWDDLDEPEHPVLFCYELQVDPAFRGLGLGKKVGR